MQLDCNISSLLAVFGPTRILHSDTSRQLQRTLELEFGTNTKPEKYN